MPETTPPSRPVRITLMGRFTITRDHRPCSLLGGQPDLVVMFLAARGGSVHAEMLAEALWPDAPLHTARSRIRNVLARTRARHPELISRRGPTLTLPEGCEIDVVQFERHCREAVLANTPDQARAHARQAVALYREPIVPDYPYADWAIELARHLQALHGRVAVLVDTATFPHHTWTGPAA